MYAYIKKQTKNVNGIRRAPGVSFLFHRAQMKYSTSARRWDKDGTMTVQSISAGPQNNLPAVFRHGFGNMGRIDGAHERIPRSRTTPGRLKRNLFFRCLALKTKKNIIRSRTICSDDGARTISRRTTVAGPHRIYAIRSGSSTPSSRVRSRKTVKNYAKGWPK